MESITGAVAAHSSSQGDNNREMPENPRCEPRTDEDIPKCGFFVSRRRCGTDEHHSMRCRLFSAVKCRFFTCGRKQDCLGEMCTVSTSHLLCWSVLRRHVLMDASAAALSVPDACRCVRTMATVQHAASAIMPAIIDAARKRSFHYHVLHHTEPTLNAKITHKSKDGLNTKDNETPTSLRAA